MSGDIQILIDGIKHLSVPDVARAKGMTRQSVSAAIRRGEMLARKEGKNWYVDAASAAAWTPPGQGGARPGAGRKKEGSND